MKKFITICFLLAVATTALHSQDKTIRGRVISDEMQILPFVWIMLQDTIKVGETDLNGFFKIDIPVSQKKILFKMVGMEAAHVELVYGCNDIEVVMMLRSTYDFLSPQKIDKRRRKEFKKLPELHEEAFKKGLFKTEKACYIEEFVCRYP